MLQRGLDTMLVRMAQSFEDERQRTHERPTRRQELGAVRGVLSARAGGWGGSL